MSNTVRIALTTGEPAGIGPDLCIMLSQQQQQADLIAIGDPELLLQRARQLKIPLQLELADLAKPATIAKAGTLRYLPATLASRVHAGRLDKHNAAYVTQLLQQALEGCIHQQFDAVVTAPVHKGIINEAGIVFTGHTEFFAQGAGVDKVVMMLATADLRVALATTHLPLSQVSQAITRADLTRIIEILHSSMQLQFGLEQPRIAVCGLNPHAGEQGHMGREEVDVITPVIEYFSRQGRAVSGPWPADTVFVEDRLASFDVILAMYHDQGLPVLKHRGFGQAVNITLGLPFIRTSVDHGTALDLAATGKISTRSLEAAVKTACQMAQSSQQ